MMPLYRIVFCVACFFLASGVASAQFKRGISLPDVMTFPATSGSAPAQRYRKPAFPDWSKAFAAAPLDALRRAGFDHVRLTVDLGPAISDSGELENLRTAIAAILRDLERHDLRLLLTLLAPAINGRIPDDILDGIDGEKFGQYLAVVVALASVAGEANARMLFEPLNEPQQACRKDRDDWQEYQKLMVARIREVAPRLPLLLTGGCWSKIEAIPFISKELLADDNVYISVHFYDPFVFTHQTTEWALPLLQAVIGVPYPAAAGSVSKSYALSKAYRREKKIGGRYFAEADAAIAAYFAPQAKPDMIKAEFEKLELWRKTTTLAPNRVVLTEFGAIRQVLNGSELERDSRARWLREVRTIAEGFGFGWTVWAWGNTSFGILEPDLSLSGDIANALGIGPIP